MRPLRSLILPLVLLAVGACHKSQPIVAQAQVYGSDADGLYFQLERTPCFGKCPAYIIKVLKNGEATWNGKANVERLGQWTVRLDEPTMARLLAEAKTAGFFGMQDKYDGEVTDLPSTILRINADGQDKRVVARYKVPQAFKSLAASCDSLLNAQAWERLAPEP